MSSILQPSFSGGELAPSLYGRVDMDRYQISLKTLRNAIVMQYGGVQHRAGTKYLGGTKNATGNIRLIPFIFNQSQTYVLEVGDLYMRFWQDGAQLESGGSPYEITTPWSEADLPLLKFTQSADVIYITHSDYPVGLVKRLGAAEFDFEYYVWKDGPFFPINTDGTIVVWLENLTDDEATLKSSGSIFSAGMLGEAFYIEQSPLVAETAWEAGEAVVAGDVRVAGINYYVAENSATTGTVRPSHLDGIKSDGVVQWKYLHSGNGICEITNYVSPTEVDVVIERAMPDSLVGTFGTVNVPASVTPYIRGLDNHKNRWTADIEVTAHGYSTGDIVVVTGVVSNRGAFEDWINGKHEITVLTANTFRLNGNVKIDIGKTVTISNVGTVRAEGTAFTSSRWARGSWGPDRGWPGCVSFFQQRLAFGASNNQPQTVWLSEISVYDGFRVDTPVAGDNAIQFTIDSQQINEVRHLVQLRDLVVLSSGAEWLLRGSNDSGLTPDNVTVDAQGYRGASHVRPLVVGNSIVYVQSRGSIIRDLGYQFEVDGYVGNDLTLFSNHLFRGKTVVDWAYAQEPESIIWVVLDDGSLLSLTYVKEQQVWGWARHDSSDGLFKAVCVVPEGDEDGVYFVVEREIDGNTVRYVERMASRTFVSLTECFFVDSGLTYDGRHTGVTTMTLTGGTTWGYPESLTLTASVSTFVVGDVGKFFRIYGEGVDFADVEVTAYTSGTVVTVRPVRLVPESCRSTALSWAAMATILTGLDHLEGESVSILADGNVHPVRTVASGSITLQEPAAVAHVGLGIESDIETLPMGYIVKGDTLRDNKKAITGIGLVLENSRGVFACRTGGRAIEADDLFELKQRQDEDWAEPTQVASGYVRLPIPTKWDRDGTVLIRQTDPLPLTVLGIIPEVTFGGKG